MNRLEKTRAFLTEFIIVILFFSIAAVITVSLFARANRISSDSIRITRAGIMSENVIEELKACVGEDNDIEQYFSENTSYTMEASGEYRQYYDKDFNVTDKESAEIFESVAVLEEEREYGTLYTFTVSFESEDETISSVETKYYVHNRADTMEVLQ